MNIKPASDAFDTNNGSDSAPKKPVLIVVHQSHSTPGRIGHWFSQQGYALDIRRPRYGDPLPETMDDHAMAIVFGGPMSANDPDDFVKTEIDWMEVPLREEAPLLGVCLGGQMLAKQLGAEVAPHSEGRWEVGYHPMSPTEEGAKVCPWPSKFFQWHGEGFTLPQGATLLAQGEHFENQAYGYGPAAIGIQFHPEMSFAMINRWTAHNARRLELPGAYPRARQLNDHVMHGPRVWSWMHDLFPKLLERRLQPANKPALSSI